jgi:4-carboxymuconolactone decarboxylase
MPRIPLPDLERLTPEAQVVVDSILKGYGRNGRLPGPYQLTLANPEFTNIWQQMGGLLRYRNSLPLRLSELAILITARIWNCRYEWFAHAPIGLQEGLEAETVEEIRWGREPKFKQIDEYLIFKYTTQLQERKKVSDQVHEDTLQSFGLKGIVDLTALVGYYTMVAMALNAHEFLPPTDVLHSLPDIEPKENRFTASEKF